MPRSSNRKPSRSARGAGASLLACLGLLASSAAADVQTDRMITLEDVLSFDPRGAEAACGNVEHGTKQPRSSAATVPPNPDGPTPVDIFLFVLAIDSIDTRTNSFRFEGYGGLIWCDPRQAFDAQAAGADFINIDGEQALRRVDQMWFPGILLPSQLGVPERTNQLLVIFSDGTVRFSVKFNTRMMARYDFARFPLDHQRLEISLQTSRWDVDETTIREATGQVGIDRYFDIPEWEVVNQRTRTERNEGFNRFVMELEIGRRVGFYLWKILLPLFIITCVAWSTFWMTRDVLAQRQRQSGTAILTVVAFQFIAVVDLPRVAYLTLMDGVILWTYVCIGTTLLTNIVNKRRFRQSEELGLKADRQGRIAFPIVYVAGILLLFAAQRLV